MGQSRRHTNLCWALAEILRAAIGRGHTLGADQLVYFDAASPRRCLAPDAFVKLGRPDPDFDSWKTWEEGAPEVAFEVLSPSDTPEMWTLDEKLGRYHQLGVRELFARLEAEQARRVEQEARHAAEARVAELEAELARARGGAS